MATRRKTSSIWNHFTLKDGKAQCNYCSEFLSTCASNTGNLARHLRRKHPAVAFCLGIKRESGLFNKTSSEASTSKTEHDHTMEHIDNYDYMQNTDPLFMHEASEIDAQLVKMIARDVHSLSIIEGPEFRKLLMLLNPGYNVPTRETLTQTLLPQIYEQTLNSVGNEISNATSVCISIESWTSFKGEFYMVLTAHYIDKDHNRCAKLLSSLRYTGLEINALLKNELNKWDVLEKIEAVVSDISPAIHKALTIEGWSKITCFANILNNVLLNGIRELHAAVIKMKQVAENHEESLLSPELIEDMTYRWNSLYDILNCIIASKDHLSEEDWEIAEHSLQILKPFYEVTMEISADKYVSLSKIIVYCRLLCQHLDIHKRKETVPIVKKLIKELRDSMHRTFYINHDVESNQLYAEATILDPRFKKNGFSDQTKYYKAFANLRQTFQENCAPIQKTQDLFPGSIWEQYIIENSVPEYDGSGAVELERYIEEPIVSLHEDPLMWWSSRKLVYPHLYEVVLKRLNIPGNAIPGERIFTKAGSELNERRASLGSKYLAELQFIASNAD
ncbi:zinc finger BED domain-containing protein 4-like [Ctenocephalides felis]|uniref:zinc finger BED domain-containing protein 4-like n=1 Tax=Ctenocephalides felis TaxID=7515 RepID=UPI000E6E3F4D|nr:zinc finger BED domain-containing protein 4-like [Ctenocephalides felis]